MKRTQFRVHITSKNKTAAASDVRDVLEEGGLSRSVAKALHMRVGGGTTRSVGMPGYKNYMVMISGRAHRAAPAGLAKSQVEEAKQAWERVWR